MARKRTRLVTDLVGKTPHPHRRSNGWYYYVFRHNGRLTWRTLNTQDFGEAVTRCQRLWYERQRAEAQEALELPDIDLEELWPAYTTTDSFKHLSDWFQKKRRSNWRAFVAWGKTHNCTMLHHINAVTVRSYLKRLGVSGEAQDEIKADIAAVSRDLILRYTFPAWWED